MGYLPYQHYCQTIKNSLSPTGINVLVQNRRVFVLLVLRGQHMSTTRGVLCCASHSMLAGRACGKLYFAERWGNMNTIDTTWISLWWLAGLVRMNYNYNRFPNPRIVVYETKFTERPRIFEMLIPSLERKDHMWWSYCCFVYVSSGSTPRPLVIC